MPDMQPIQRELLERLNDIRREVERLNTKEYAAGGAFTTYSGTPVAGRLAQWAGAGTVTHTDYAGSAVARYSGTPTAGAVTYWTGAGTVVAATFGTATVARTDTAQIFTARQGFANGMGLNGGKSAAHNTLTNLCDIIVSGGGALSATYLVAVTVNSANSSSSQIWVAAQGFSSETITLLTEALFGHTSIVLTVTGSTSNRKMTVAITQQNSASQTCVVEVSVTPLMVSADATVTLTIL